MRRSSLTLLFVTHDREFLKALATRTVELDRGKLFDFACDYETFLRRREEALHAEEQEWQRFDRKLAQEEVWIRQGIKARRTRNMGRVGELQRMRAERLQRRQRLGTSRLQLQEAGRSGKLVAELEDVCFSYGDKPVIQGLSTTIIRGDRVGIIGPNGAGKSTLLKLILGQLTPQQGQARLGTNLEILYFDQLREQLDPDATVQQNLSGDQDTVLVGGTPRHVYGYLQDFLFTPDRARTPVRILSGGERHRLLLAKLFTREANVLVMDEPTNDLDLETLELLEELLAEFTGTVLLVSHDRAFLDRVVTGTLVYEGDGRFTDYVGGYQDWLRQRPAPEPEPAAVKSAKTKPERVRPRKLTFKERQELEALPTRIDALENEQAALHEKLADPAFYREQGDAVAVVRRPYDYALKRNWLSALLDGKSSKPWRNECIKLYSVIVIEGGEDGTCGITGDLCGDVYRAWRRALRSCRMGGREPADHGHCPVVGVDLSAISIFGWGLSVDGLSDLFTHHRRTFYLRAGAFRLGNGSFWFPAQSL